MLGKQRYCKMVLAVPGPKPKCMDAYLDALGEKLAQLSAGVWHCALQDVVADTETDTQRELAVRVSAAYALTGPAHSMCVPRTQGQPGQQQPQQQQPQQQQPEGLPASKRIPALQRREIAARVTEVVLHPQTNRPLRNPVRYHAGMHMDELADGVRGLFALLFWRTRAAGSGLPLEVLHDSEVKKAWGHLRRFACFHLAEHAFASQMQLQEAVDAAQQELLEYCKLAEQVRQPGFLGGTNTTVGRAYAQLGWR
jgi:hypothetical protein